MRVVSGNRFQGSTCIVLRLRLLVPIGILISVLSACAVVRVSRPLLKIGLVGPFEGQYRYVGYDAINAARLALREANAAGGVGGYSVELVAYDDQGTVAGARRAARSLASDPQVIAVIGHFLDETTTSARELYDQFGLPLVVAGTVEGPRSEEPGLLCPLLRFLSEDDGPGARHVQWITAGPAELPCGDGPELTISNEIPPASSVDSVVMTLDPVTAAETLIALQNSGWRGVVSGDTTLGSPLFASITDPADVIFVTPFRWPESDGQDSRFDRDYQSLGPHVPPPGPFALKTYQVTQHLLELVEILAWRNAVPDRETLDAALIRQPNDTVFIYRWTLGGSLELVREETLSRE